MSTLPSDGPIFGFNGEYFWLSNFYVEFDGLTAEHRFQASKASTDEGREWIMRAPSPGEAKHRGRTVQMRPDWDTYRHTAMKLVLLFKFREIDLRARLSSTDSRELVEANTWHDTYWGVDKWTGNGENHLGKTLMALRTEYKEGLYG